MTKFGPTGLTPEEAERLVQRHASAYVARGAAISDAIVAECKAARDELLTALRGATRLAQPAQQELDTKTKTLETIEQKIADYERTMSLPGPKELKEIWYCARKALGMPI